MNKLNIIAALIAFVVVVRGADLGTKCDDGDCDAIDNAICSKNDQCEKGYCTCNGASYYGQDPSDTKKCKQYKTYDQECSKDGDCYSGMTCKSSKCACSHDYLYQEGGTCVGHGLNGACTSDSSCYTSNTECKDGYCKCKSDYTDYSGYCIKGALHEETCSADSDCATMLSLKCDAKKCACTLTDYEWRSNGGKSACIHKDAKLDLGGKEECNGKNDKDAKMCGSGLMCATCPGESKSTCMSGASAVYVSGFAMMLVSVLAILKI
jgi:hypothetical protein